MAKFFMVAVVGVCEVMKLRTAVMLKMSEALCKSQASTVRSWKTPHSAANKHRAAVIVCCWRLNDFVSLYIMSRYQFHGKLQALIEYAESGTESDVHYIFSHLNQTSDFAMTRFVDFALSVVESEAGKERIRFYLFHGTQIQRNYASLYFNRLGEWEIVKAAFDQGLIDEVQAFAR